MAAAGTGGRSEEGVQSEAAPGAGEEAREEGGADEAGAELVLVGRASQPGEEATAGGVLGDKRVSQDKASKHSQSVKMESQVICFTKFFHRLLLMRSNS